MTRSISFRFLQPGGVHPAWLMWFLIHRPRLRRAFEYANTRAPAELRSLFWELSLMRRMSSLAVGMLLRELVARMPPGHAYVNVGIWEGFSLFAGMAGNEDKICIGIDDYSQFDRPREKFLRNFGRVRRSPLHVHRDVDYETYFATMHEGPIGVYYYDGGHGYENQRKNLEIVERFLVPGSIVIVDDTDYPEPRRATEDYLSSRPGMYDRAFDVSVSRPGHPTWWNGLVVLRRR